MVAVLVVLGGLAFITLGPQPMSSDGWGTTLLGVVTGRPGVDWASDHVLEFGANIALFVPVGVVLVLVFGRRRWWLAIIVAALGTAGIELAQQVLASRISSPLDVVANTSGAAIGVAVAGIVGTLVARRRPSRVDRLIGRG